MQQYDAMFGVSFVVGSASEDNPEYPSEGQYPTTTTSGKKPIDHITNG